MKKTAIKKLIQEVEALKAERQPEAKPEPILEPVKAVKPAAKGKKK